MESVWKNKVLYIFDTSYLNRNKKQKKGAVGKSIMGYGKTLSNYFDKKKYNKTLISAVLFVCILLLCCLASVPVQAKETAAGKQLVRVGFFGFEGYHEQDEDGNRSGYGYDFLQMIAPYADFEYEYVGYENSWSDMLRMLQDGEIDLVTSAKKTPEREKIYEFSEKNMGISFTVLTTHPDNTKYTISDYSTLDGIRVGLMKGSVRVQGFDKYAEKHGFSYVPVYYPNQREILKALAEGKDIDAVVTSDLRILGDEAVIDKFDEAKIYTIAQKGNDELIKRVDAAIEQLSADSPGWMYDLSDRYYSRSSSGNKLQLTTEERLYIKDLNARGKKLKVLVNPDMEPYTYFEDGHAKGILVDLLNVAAKKAGFSYEIMETANSQEYLDVIKSGRADVVFDAVFDYNTAEKTGYYLTVPYYTATYARMTSKKNNPREGAAAVRKSGGILGDRFLTRFMDENTIDCDTFDECVNALRSGKADCTYVFTYTASKYVGSDYTNSFDYEVVKDMSCPIAAAVRTERGRLLYSIISKSVSSIDTEQRDAAVNANTQYNVKGGSLLYFIYNEPVTVISIIVFMTTVIMILVLWFRMREKAAEKLHRETDARQKEALREAYEAADRANHAKSDFLSGISHDIRTPLNAIIGMVAIARAHSDDPNRVADCLGKINTSSRHLLGLINEVLDMSKIESGKVSLTEEEFNLSDLLDNLVELVQPGIKEKKHELIVRIYNIKHENVIGDSLRIQQAFVNIVGNATKYTQEGGRIEINVSELPSNAPKIGTYKFVFKDNGIGMSEDYIKTIFDPFSREKDSIVNKIQGTGLGMAITKNIVQMMDGSINVESEQGKGSVFTVVIRLKLQAGETAYAQEFAGLPVLVADNDQNICENTCMILNEIGMKSEFVLSGSEAVERVSKAHEEGNDFYAVIVDRSMPEMDGLKTMRAIRTALGETALILILAAYDWSDIEGDARTAGADYFISKPLFKSKLIGTFEEILHRDNPKEEVNAVELLKQMDFSGKHLLLVEDNALNREIAREIIGMTKIQIDTAENGEIAVQKFRESPHYYYDVILMDVQMPVMNGYDASIIIRSMERPDTHDVPIIALTANAFAEDVEKALAAQMNEHLAKPMDIQKLVDVLNRWIGDKA